ncbi:MAG: CHASE3 domain-containing protein [Puia sp.]
MKFDFPKKIRSGYLAAFILMLLCYFLSLSSFIQLRKENKWVGHTREVINELGTLNADLKDAEINWHEYLLSKQATYLHAYNESRHLVDSVYQVLATSVSDNPEEKRRLESMHEIIERKYKVLDAEMGILQRSQLQVNDSLLYLDSRNMSMIDSISLVSDSIKLSENKLLALRTQKVMFYSKIVF